MAIRGTEYKNLPYDFTISSTTQQACDEVWQTFAAYKPSLRSRAIQRFESFLKNTANSKDEQERRLSAIYEHNLAYITRIESEFGMQIYSDGKNVIKGRVHKGSGRRIYEWNKDRDGIPNNQTIVFVHNHLDDMTISVGDTQFIVSGDKNVPRYWLYFAAGPSMYHLMFPTLETPTHNPATFRQDIANEFGNIYDEAKSTALIHGGQVDLMRAIASKYRLGYYSGLKGLTLPKVR